MGGQTFRNVLYLGMRGTSGDPVVSEDQSHSSPAEGLVSPTTVALHDCFYTFRIQTQYLVGHE
jgi:hypothetical protein